MGAFLHVADVHIGANRLDGRLPSRDFADAFARAARVAIDERVDFLLVAGDFFDRPRIEPAHLSEAETPLALLRDARIPVVAIEGNHDLASPTDPRPTWLNYLNQRGLVRLLRTEFRDGAPVMKPWTPDDPTGNWLEIAGTRIIGMGYAGASTARRLELLEPAIERVPAPTVLALHAGIDHLHGEFGHITSRQLAPLRGRVDYVAVGHVHRRYVVDGWIHNPGSLENWRLDEEAFGDEKGAFLVRDGHAEPVAIPRRPVRLATVPCQGLGSVAALEERVLAEAATWRGPRETAVQLALTGLPAFDPAQIDGSKLARLVEETFPCAAADVVVRLTRADLHAGAHAGAAEATPRETIEREELTSLIAATGRYEENTELMLEFVREALVLGLRGASDDEIYDALTKRGLCLSEGETRVEDSPPAAVERKVVPGR